MRKFVFIAFALMSLSSCHESLEERAERESKEFTQKNCPMPVTKDIVIDSMVYERQSRTIHYFYSLRGETDTTAIDKTVAKKELLKGIKGDTSIRKYKEEGFNFAYTYLSTKHKGLVLIDARFTEKDYKDRGR